MSATLDDNTRQLFDAIFDGDDDRAHELVLAGANINALDDSQYSPLMVACVTNDGSARLVRELVKGGAKVNFLNDEGKTALHIAATADWSEDDKRIVAALLLSGADVDARLPGGWTPLMEAATDDGSAAKMQALLRGGADRNAADKNGITPLMIAAMGFRETRKKITLLITSGANAKLKCNAGLTAFDYIDKNKSVWNLLQRDPNIYREIDEIIDKLQPYCEIPGETSSSTANMINSIRRQTAESEVEIHAISSTIEILRKATLT